MQHQSADPGEFAAPGAASSTALVTGPNGRGSAIITPPVPAIPAETVIAEAIVLAEPKTATGMIARANELHRAGVVDRCAELFRIVAHLKDEVLRERMSTWKDFVEKNFTFSLATADNYARVGRGTPTVLTALGAIRHLHPSGQPGQKAKKKTVSKEEMAAASEAETTEKKTAPDTLMSGAASIPSQPRETTVSKAVRALTRACRSERLRQMLVAQQAETLRLNKELDRARARLWKAQEEILEAYRQLKAEA